MPIDHDYIFENCVVEHNGQKWRLFNIVKYNDGSVIYESELVEEV